MPQANASILQLKVSLRGIRPPIWRRILVRSDVTLDRLHRILQTIMGWTDSHLHEFQAGDVQYGAPDPDGGTDGPAPETRMRLGQLLERPKDRLLYTYDFGDSWEHDLVLEAVLLRESGMKYPHVLAGKRACPPEDVGGVWGYAHFLKTIRNPGHSEHDDMLAWSGGSFDPEAFDPQAVNRAFHGGWAPTNPREASPTAPAKRHTPSKGTAGEVLGALVRFPTTKILTDDEIALAVHGLRELLGEAVLRLSPGFDPEVFVRFQAVAEKCREARGTRGLDMKQAAQALGVKLDELRKIEGASVGHLDPGILTQYLRFLNLQRWYGRWKTANPAAAAKLGIAAPPTTQDKA